MDTAYSFNKASPIARELMPDDFFWSPTEENGPYGNDDGWESIEGFIKWRVNNKELSPVQFLYKLINEWGYPSFDWNELDPEKIIVFIKSVELSEDEIQKKISDIKETLKTAQSSPEITYTDELIREWAIGMDTNLNIRILLGYDNGIIGAAFAQIAIEGCLHKDLKYLASIAIQRQLLPLLINNYDTAQKEKRKEQLQKMLTVIKNV